MSVVGPGGIASESIAAGSIAGSAAQLQTSGIGAGTSSSSGVGAAQDRSAASGTGTSSASATGAAHAASSGSALGSSTGLGNDAAHDAATGAASGTSSASGTGSGGAQPSTGKPSADGGFVGPSRSTAGVPLEQWLRAEQAKARAQVEAYEAAIEATRKRATGTAEGQSYARATAAALASGAATTEAYSWASGAAKSTARTAGAAVAGSEAHGGGVTGHVGSGAAVADSSATARGLADQSLIEAAFKRAQRMDATPRDRALATARTAAALRAMHGGRPRTRIPRAVYPKVIELEYGKAMIGLVDAARGALAPLLRELPELVTSAAHHDSARRDVGEAAHARQLIDLARHHLAAAIRTEDVEALARKFADRTQVQQRGQFAKQVKAALGADVFASDKRVPQLVDNFVHENAALITSIPAQITDGIEQLTTRAIAAGTLHPALAEEIEERFAIGARRARLIARDQIGSLHGRLNSYRQQDLGIASFRWATCGDERVRPEHAELDGQEFRWDDPPDEGIPGTPINCRCSAEPVFDAILDALDDGDEDEDAA